MLEHGNIESSMIAGLSMMDGSLTGGGLTCREMYPQDYAEPPEPVDWDDVYKTPAYVVQALRHPYQEGSFSRKQGIIGQINL